MKMMKSTHEELNENTFKKQACRPTHHNKGRTS